MEFPLQCKETLCNTLLYHLYMYEVGGEQCHELGTCSFQEDAFFFEQGSGILLRPEDLMSGTMVITASFLLQDAEYCVHTTPAIDFRQLSQLRAHGDSMDFRVEDQYLFRFYYSTSPGGTPQYGLSAAWIQANSITLQATIILLQQLQEEQRQRELELHATELLLRDVQQQLGLKRKRLADTNEALQAMGVLFQKISHVAEDQQYDNYRDCTMNRE